MAQYIISGSYTSAAMKGMIAHPSRLTQRWYDKALAGGLSEGQYVELVATVATVVMIDTFCRGVGPVRFHYVEPGNNGYDAELTAYVR